MAHLAKFGYSEEDTLFAATVVAEVKNHLDFVYGSGSDDDNPIDDDDFHDQDGINYHHNNYTPYLFHCYLGNTDIVKYLVKKGCDRNVTQSSGFMHTAMHIVCEKGHTDLLDYFLEHRFYDVDIRSGMGFTPLFRSLKHIDIVTRLLAHGADPNAVADYGYVPLCNICMGPVEVFDHLINAGADWNRQFGNGETPLHIAAKFERADLIERLFGLNCDIEVKTIKKGKTAYDYAVKSGNKHIIELFHSYMAGKKK